MRVRTDSEVLVRALRSPYIAPREIVLLLDDIRSIAASFHFVSVTKVCRALVMRAHVLATHARKQA